MHRPWTVALTASLLLLTLALPFIQIRLGQLDDRALPPGAATARVAAALRTGYPHNPLSSTQIVLPGFDPTTRGGELDDYARRMSQVPGVTQVDTATGAYRHGELAGPPTPVSARFASPEASTFRQAARMTRPARPTSNAPPASGHCRPPASPG